MPFDPDKQKDIDRLVESVRWSRKQMEPFRKNRVAFARQFVGHRYSDDGASNSVATNLIELFVNTMMRTIAPTSPAAFITTTNRSLTRQRMRFELALNNLGREIDVGTTIRTATCDALFGMGVAKVGINESSKEVGGYLHDPGQVYVDWLSMDNFVYDTSAPIWERIDYAGHDFVLPREQLLEEYRVSDEEDVPKLDGDRLHFGDSEDRITDVSRGTNQEGSHDIRDYARAWEFWLPYENLIITLPGSETGIPVKGAKPIRVTEWAGPEMGPFVRLGFTYLPGNTMPISPISTLYDLHMLANALFRKSSKQSENQKTLLAGRKGREADANVVKGSPDMEVVLLDDPSSLTPMRFNGADQSTINMGELVRDLFNRYSGNVEALAGISAPSEHATTDKLLEGNASKRVEEMQDAVLKFTEDIYRSMGYWLWTDPITDYSVVHRHPGTSHEVELVFTPEDREADFYEWNIQINPYSTRRKTPMEEYQTFWMLWNQIIMPNRAEMEASGAGVNMVKVIRRAAELLDFKSIDDFIQFVAPVGAPRPTSGNKPPSLEIQVPQASSNQGRGDQARTFQRVAGAMSRMTSGDGSGVERMVG